MNLEWQDYLRGEGALLEHGVVSGFTTAAPSTSLPGLAALTDSGVIRVNGDDAATFMQAHFCNDVSSVTDEQTQLSGYCSPKGRLLTVFNLSRHKADYLLVLPREVIESMLKRLNMFAQMARPAGKKLFGQVTKTAVNLIDASDELMVIGLETAGSAELIASLDTKTFQIPNAPGAAQRYLCVATTENAMSAWRTLKPVSSTLSTEVWRLGDIRAGSPSVVLATQDTFVPQMANMHLLQGVSFTKGCYPGQEIVARMQYLGTLKRRMERFRVDFSGVQPGLPICTSTDNAAGVVVQAATTGAGPKDTELLAVMKISVLDGQVLHLGSAEGPVLERLPMPYPVDAELTPAQQKSS